MRSASWRVCAGDGRVGQRQLVTTQLGEQPGERGIRRRAELRGPRRHHAGRFDPRQQLPGPPVGDRNARPDLGEGVPVDRRMGPCLDRAEGGLAGHRRGEPPADRPAGRRTIVAPVRGEGVDMGEEDAVWCRSVASSPTGVGGDGIFDRRVARFGTNERGGQP